MWSSIPSWLIISLVILVLIILLIRLIDQIYLLSMIKDNFFYIFLVIVLIFVTFSIAKIHAHNKIDLTSADGIKAAAKIYYSWLANVFSNIGKVAGYAIHQSWVENNSTKTVKPPAKTK
jgi:hypothetical protein